jgi:hypothetical protein
MGQENDATYVLVPPKLNSEASTADIATMPMMVFCVDISASMSTTLKLKGGGSMTRLQCVQAAVTQQLEALRRQQPDCVVVLITFGMEVCTYTAGGSRALIARRAHDNEADLLAKGVELSSSCSEPVAAAVERLQATVAGLKPCGNTALGPALAVAVGLAGSQPGSKIILCTDGMANNGVGAIRDRSTTVPFYGEIGRRAAEEGTCISVITMEGEDCSMENLGACADLTGGQVEMLDLQELAAKVGAIVANPVLATRLEVTVMAGRGTLCGGEATVESKGTASVAVRKLGSATARSDLTLELKLGGLMEEQLRTLAPVQGDGAPLFVPLQVQLRYTRPDGAQVLQVFTSQVPCSARREEAEADIDGAVVGLGGLHGAARLAQQGAYRAARALLISTCRLLQRAMYKLAHQESYLSFIVQAEKLDGFMRERELQDKILGATANSALRGRDDDASRSMYNMKSLSMEEFVSRRA